MTVWTVIDGKVYYTPEYVDYLRGLLDKADKALDRCRDCMEDIAIGTQMKCSRCNNYHPCGCDR